MTALQNWPNILPTTGWRNQNPSILMTCGAVGMKFLPEQIVPHSSICWASNLFLLSEKKKWKYSWIQSFDLGHESTGSQRNPLVIMLIKEVEFIFSISGFLIEHLCRGKLLKSLFGSFINKKTATTINKEKKATLATPAHRNPLQWQNWS